MSSHIAWLLFFLNFHKKTIKLSSLADVIQMLTANNSKEFEKKIITIFGFCWNWSHLGMWNNLLKIR